MMTLNHSVSSFSSLVIDSGRVVNLFSLKFSSLSDVRFDMDSGRVVKLLPFNFRFSSDVSFVMDSGRVVKLLLFKCSSLSEIKLLILSGRDLNLQPFKFKDIRDFRFVIPSVMFPSLTLISCNERNLANESGRRSTKISLPSFIFLKTSVMTCPSSCTNPNCSSVSLLRQGIGTFNFYQ